MSEGWLGVDNYLFIFFCMDVTKNFPKNWKAEEEEVQPVGLFPVE